MDRNAEFNNGIKFLIGASNKQSTKDSYDKVLKPYWAFCARYDLDSLVASPRRVQQFLWYMFKYTTKKSGPAKRAITALGNYWITNGIEWKLSDNPSISKMLKGYQDLKPSDTNLKRPFSYFHMRKAIRILNLNTYSGMLLWEAFTIGYFGGGRSSEYSVKSQKSIPFILRRCDAEIINSDSARPTLVYNFRRHKTNRFGLYRAKVAVECTCDQEFCPVHLSMRFYRLRDKIHGNNPDQPLLLQFRDGNFQPILYTHINNAIKKMASEMGLNPDDYATHSFRSGRCTDLSRARIEDRDIQEWGRWRSDCWKDHYRKLDFTDIARVSKLSYAQLGFQRTNIDANLYRLDNNVPLL